MRYGIMLHGGAGTRKAFGGARLERIRARTIEAVEVGMTVLAHSSSSALDAVEEAVAFMERSQVFNAGLGSCLTLAKTIEMDAGIMDGRHLRAGSVGAIRDVVNAVRVARRVMEDTAHILIVGEAATRFARQHGLAEPISVSNDQLKRYEEEVAKRNASRQMSGRVARVESGTVGAVAIDRDGNLASAVSTGGLWLKREGRVGDSAVVGAGFYADNRVGAAGATGFGEAILRLCLSKLAIDLVRTGLDSKSACEQAIGELAAIGGWGGLIAVDRNGRFGFAYNSEGMPTAYRISDMTSPIARIFADGS